MVIEECDSLDLKSMVRAAARDARIPVLMETSDRGLLDHLRHVDRMHEQRWDRAGVDRARRHNLRLLLCLRSAARERDDVRHERT